jgi:hypothetical protein
MALMPNLPSVCINFALCYLPLLVGGVENPRPWKVNLDKGSKLILKPVEIQSIRGFSPKFQD